ncbi:MAG: sigma factor, partial [Clostridia bacterium]|nr:sigma factor [Clostridia bacterium]
MQSLFSLLRRACGMLLKKHGEVYYINGSETLPPPLSANEENEITARLSDEPELKSYLIEHNLRLVVYIAKKFENTGIGIEDLISIGTIGLIKAVGTFCADRGIKLATYASRC